LVHPQDKDNQILIYKAYYWSFYTWNIYPYGIFVLNSKAHCWDYLSDFPFSELSNIKPILNDDEYKWSGSCIYPVHGSGKDWTFDLSRYPPMTFRRLFPYLGSSNWICSYWQYSFCSLSDALCQNSNKITSQSKFQSICNQPIIEFVNRKSSCTKYFALPALHRCECYDKVIISDDLDTILVVTSDHRIIRSYNGGGIWDSIQVNDISSFDIFGITHTPFKCLWAKGTKMSDVDLNYDYEQLFYSTNDGSHWIEPKSPKVANYFRLNHHATFISNDTLYGLWYRWIPYTSKSDIYAFKCDHPDSFVANLSSNLNIGGPGFKPANLIVDPNNPSRWMFLVNETNAYGFKASNLYASFDAGVSWNKINLDDILLKSYELKSGPYLVTNGEQSCVIITASDTSNQSYYFISSNWLSNLVEMTFTVFDDPYKLMGFAASSCFYVDDSEEWLFIYDVENNHQRLLRNGFEFSIINTIAAIDNVPEDQQVSIYQKDGKFLISFAEPLTQSSKIRIYDLQGRLLHTFQLAADVDSFIIQDWKYSAGVYFMNLKIADKTISRKFIFSR